MKNILFLLLLISSYSFGQTVSTSVIENDSWKADSSLTRSVTMLSMPIKQSDLVYHDYPIDGIAAKPNSQSRPKQEQLTIIITIKIQ